jgi:MoaA/NifB/PqqE/SkfB family radical SAM enzyme
MRAKVAGFAYVQLTRTCTQECLFCSNPPSGVELTEPELAASLDQFERGGYGGVILTGGEPTLSPLLFPALRLAGERGLEARVITNGQRLADRGFYEACVLAGLRHIHLSLYSSFESVHDYLTRRPGSWRRAVRCLEHSAALDVRCDVNTVINTYNADHLDLTVRWVDARFPAVRHYVWNNLDPSGVRARSRPDTTARLAELEVPLALAMTFLARRRRTFRVERVPLCRMRRFAHASTETRKIVKGEERLVRFLDGRGLSRQQDFGYDKARACAACRLRPICAGVFGLGEYWGEDEVAPVLDDPLPIVQRILGRGPEGEELVRLGLAGAAMLD